MELFSDLLITYFGITTFLWIYIIFFVLVFTILGSSAFLFLWSSRTKKMDQQRRGE